MLLLLLIFDILLLFNTKRGILADRKLPEKMSNGDHNDVELYINNQYGFRIICGVIDEIPEEFQVRDFLIFKSFSPKESSTIPYKLRPTFRSWRIINGRLYIFGGKGSRDGFYVDVPRNIGLADKYWNEEVKGSNAFVQRVKRYIFNRVPHYKSGEELADEVHRTGGGKS